MQVKEKGFPATIRLRTIWVRFVLGVVVYYLLTVIPWVDRHVIYPMLMVTAEGAGHLLGGLGYPVVTQGVRILGPDFSLAVQRGCDPLDPICFLSIGIWVFPAPFWKKGWGWLAGCTFLFVFNLIRVVSLYLIGRNRSPLFQPIHQEWWPLVFVLITLMVWVSWLFWVRKPQTE